MTEETGPAQPEPKGEALPDITAEPVLDGPAEEARPSWWARISPTDGTMLAWQEDEPADKTDFVPIPVGCDLVRKLGRYAWNAERKCWLPRKGITTTSQTRIALDHLTPMMLALMVEQWARDPLAGPPAVCIEWATEYRKSVDAAVLRKVKNPRLKDLRGKG